MNPRDFGIALALVSTLGCVAQPDDEKIVRSVEEALSEDEALHDIAATSRKGYVTLSGIARSAADRSHAEALARAAQGVVAVRNDINLSPPPVASPPPMGSTDDMLGDHGAMMGASPANTKASAGDAPSGS